MTPIERAARALWQQSKDKGNWRADTWAEETEGDQQAFRDRARAVLQAIREPSKAMIEAASETDAPYSWTEEGARERGILKWNAMIDKALEEG